MNHISNVLLQIASIAEFIVMIMIIGGNICKYNQSVFIYMFAEMVTKAHPIKYCIDHYDIFVPNNPFSVLTSEPINDIPILSEEFAVELVYVREEEEHEEDIYTVLYRWHILTDVEDCKNYIGLILEVVDSLGNVVYCVDIIMNARSFFRFPFQLVKTHFLDMVYYADEDLPLMVAADLCRLVGDYGLMDVPANTIVFKTCWISFIQRAWRRVYAERMRRLRMRGGLKAQRRFELCGKYGISSGGGLKGMLYPLSRLLIKTHQI